MNWKTILAAGAILFTSTLYAQTPDGNTPATETVCDSVGLIGKDIGLCNAYCEAMDCDSDNPQASSKACAKILAEFEESAGTAPPCDLEPVSCPCNFDLAFWTLPQWNYLNSIDLPEQSTSCADGVLRLDGSYIEEQPLLNIILTHTDSWIFGSHLSDRNRVRVCEATVISWHRVTKTGELNGPSTVSTQYDDYNSDVYDYSDGESEELEHEACLNDIKRIADALEIPCNWP